MRIGFAIIFCCLPFIVFPINLDSLYTSIALLPDTQKITILTNQCIKLSEDEKDIYKELAFEAYKKAIQVNDPYYNHLSLYHISRIYYYLNEMDSAEYFVNLINYSDNYSTLVGNTYFLKGRIKYNEGNYFKALDYFTEAQTIYDSIKNNHLYTKINIDIGNVYAQQGQFNKAKNYYQHALDMAILRNEPKIEASALNNMAIMYKKENKLDEALNYLKKALKIKEELNLYISVALTLSNIGDLHAEKNEFSEALYYHNKAIKIKEKHNDMSGIGHSYNRIGLIYFKMERYYDAINTLTKAQEILVEIDYLKGLQENYKTLAQVYSKMRMFKNAFENEEKYSDLTEKLFNEFTTAQIEEVRIKYENEKKNKEIALLQKENELIENQINKQRIVRLLLIILLFSSVLVIFLFYNRFRIKKSANSLLSRQNKEIKQKNEEIESQSEYLSNLNKELEKLSIVASKTDNAIMILDSKTNIEWVNEGFTRMYGYTLQEIKNNKNKELIGSLANLDIKDIVNIWYGEKKTISIETLNTTKSGEQVWSQSTITPITNKEKNVQFLVVIESDITALKKAGEEITRKSNELLSSIEYAKKIQQAFMPKANSLKNNFKDHFVFLRPRDVVSGDFYWFSEIKDKFILAAADCTGHGVPGAFMSLIGINFLNQIIINEEIIKPNEILNKLRKNVSTSLNKFNKEVITRDGMDISIIVLDKDKKKLEYAGAMSTMYINRKKEIIELSGDKMPIGYDEFINEKYTAHQIDLEENDTLYLFTDGYPDQFGGKNNKKFKYSNFKELFKQISDQPLNYQKELISNTYVEWKGINEQVDDILIIGLKI
jgi:PAS domain S-box-containing protein